MKTHHLDLSPPRARIESRRFVTSHVKAQRLGNLSHYVATIAAACHVEIPHAAPEDYRAATWDELRASEARGLAIGSHTRSHAVLSSLDDERVAAELDHSKRRLNEELVRSSQVFCYPSGTKKDFSRSHEKLVKAANYQGAVSTISQTSYLRAIRQNPYRVTRTGFPTKFEQFVRYSSWFEALRSKLPIKCIMEMGFFARHKEWTSKLFGVTPTPVWANWPWPPAERLRRIFCSRPSI